MRVYTAPLIVAAAVLGATPTAALAWSRTVHMVIADIAYDDLAARSPETIPRLAALLAKHPDRAAFEAAAGPASGEDKARRLFEECARWPDDARLTVFDQAAWHYAFQPVVLSEDPPPKAPPPGAYGEARQAYALNAATLADPGAADAARAQALCWIMHVTGDIQQPLHAAQKFSAADPDGDHGGALAWVKDPQTGEAISLHWFWDLLPVRGDSPAQTRAAARDLAARLPRMSLATGANAKAGDFAAWASESYGYAVSDVYGPRINAGRRAEDATVVPEAYLTKAKALAERRVTLGGYRLADVLIEAAGAPRP
jgi:hypothetical protein